MSTRLESLGELLDAPLLVTDLTNVEYLTGLASSNAAVLVQPGGAATSATTLCRRHSSRALTSDRCTSTQGTSSSSSASRIA